MYSTSRPRSMVKVVKFTETHNPGLVSTTVLWGEGGVWGEGGGKGGGAGGSITFASRSNARVAGHWHRQVAPTLVLTRSTCLGGLSRRRRLQVVDHSSQRRGW